MTYMRVVDAHAAISLAARRQTRAGQYAFPFTGRRSDRSCHLIVCTSIGKVKGRVLYDTIP